MNNAEWIRSMNDIELATWLSNLCQLEPKEDGEDYISAMNISGREIEIRHSYGDWLKWLEEKAKK